MNIKNRLGLAISLVLLSTSSVTAASQVSQAPVLPLATPTPTLSDKVKLEINNQVQEEVDRAFGHTTTLLNILGSCVISVLNY